MKKSILISDFDGTMTRFDFYDLVCKEFPSIAGGFWAQYERGEITHFEALRSIFAGIRAPESKLLAIIDAMQIDPHLPRAVRELALEGWDVAVASAGCDWYIKRLLVGQGVSVRVHANPGEFFPDRGLVMQLPPMSPFFSAELGVNKVAVVREALKTFDRVAFAGDGRPDLAPALLVPAKRRFAKSWLAQKLKEIGEGFHPFEDWHDAAAMLVKEETHP
jgi:2-hydroxy-3-keto-5-methylthiopentenyl-1-phosphate phosphatase